MFCPYCGKPVGDDKKFCIHCGASLTPPPAHPGSTLPRIPAPRPQPARKAQPARAGGSRLPLIAGIVILAMVIAFLAYSAVGATGLFPVGSAAKPAGSPAIPPGERGPEKSYVIVETQTHTPAPAPVIPVTTALLTTAITTIPTIKKPTICSSDMFACNDRCTNIRTDSRNCGRCGVACSPGMSCQNGNCRVNCTTDETSCQDGCFNISSDAKHCGSCTNSCPRGLICEHSTCTAPATPMPVPL